jgi:hypothetical protein
VQLAVIDDPVFSSYVYFETYLDFHRRLLAALAAKDVHVVPLFADFIAPEYEYYFNDTCHLTLAVILTPHN